MGHGHSHAHSHAPRDYGRALATGIVLNTAFVLVEFIYGYRSGSLALVADAGHNLSDVMGLLLAWGAAVLSRRTPTLVRTYGLRRSSVLAALTNAVVLLVAVGAILWEAIARLGHPEPVAGRTVMIVAAVGILINGATAALFASGRKGDVNIRGAYLHMVADAAVSAGVLLSGGLVMATGWYWLDPATSLVVSIVILSGTWGLLRESANLALDAVPEGIDIRAVDRYLRTLGGVIDVHDLHVWGMSTTEAALTAHLVLAEPLANNKFLRGVEKELHDRFHIEHATLQLELSDGSAACGCRLHTHHAK